MDWFVVLEEIVWFFTVFGLIGAIGRRGFVIGVLDVLVLMG